MRSSGRGVPQVLHRPVLHGERLLIIAGIAASTQHFHWSACLAKNVTGFCVGKARFTAISECHLTMAADDPFRPGKAHPTTRRGYAGIGLRGGNWRRFHVSGSQAGKSLKRVAGRFTSNWVR